MVSAFDLQQPGGYSPWPQARQVGQFNRLPGQQGQPEGIAGGQGQGLGPQAEIWGGGTQPTSPPSSVPAGSTWHTFGSEGEGQSSLQQPDAGVQPQPQQAPQPQWTDAATANAQGLAQALMSPTAGYRPQPQPTARQAWGNLMRGY